MLAVGELWRECVLSGTEKGVRRIAVGRSSGIGVGHELVEGPTEVAEVGLRRKQSHHVTQVARRLVLLHFEQQT